MLAGGAAALHTVAGARTPTVASDSAAAASAAGRFNVQQTSLNPYFLFVPPLQTLKKDSLLQCIFLLFTFYESGLGLAVSASALDISCILIIPS
jgi:hypothetical protein